jgi:hypothetical protein
MHVEWKGKTSGRGSKHLHCACGGERKHFREGKVRISMWELKGITSGRESNNLHCACGMERKHFMEGKVRISLWIKRKYFWGR